MAPKDTRDKCANDRELGRTVRELFGGRVEQFASNSVVELFGVNNRKIPRPDLVLVFLLYPELHHS
jgi:hypothetical protein